MIIFIALIAIIIIIAVIVIVMRKSKSPIWQNNKIFRIFSVVSIILSVFEVVVAGSPYFLKYLPEKLVSAIGNMSLAIVLVPLGFFAMYFICFLVQVILFTKIKDKQQKDRDLFVASCIFFLLAFIAVVVYMFWLNEAFSDFGFDFVFRYIS